MNVLVTGVAGFIGAAISARLRDEGYQVLGLDDLSTGSLLNVPRGIDFVQVDVSDPNALSQIERHPEAILHLAGQSSGELSFANPINDLTRNTASTLNLIKFAQERGVEKLIYASSMSVYGDCQSPVLEETSAKPKSCYGVSKLASELYLRAFSQHLNTVSLRMFNVYGPGQDLNNLHQGMVSIFLAMAVRRGVINVRGSLDRFRDFVYIGDVVDSWLAVLRSSVPSGTVINVGTGVKTTVRELVNSIVMLNPGTTIIQEDETPGDQVGVFADIGRLCQVVNADDFVSLEEGLERFDRWVKSR